MSAQDVFQAGFSSALEVIGEALTYTSRDLTDDPCTCQGAFERLGPDDESYNSRVGTRWALEILAADLVSDTGSITLTPQKRDQLIRSASGEILKVVEISLEWGLYRLVCELDGRPVPV